MAVSFGGLVNYLRTSTENPSTWTHNVGVTNPKGVVVALVNNGVQTDYVTSVLYGTENLVRIQRNTDTLNERGASDLWFLGSGLPTGNQTVTVNFSSGISYDYVMSSITFYAGADTEVVDNGGYDQNRANPAVVLSPGVTALGIMALFSGKYALSQVPLLSGMTAGHGHDFGSQVAVTARQTTPSASNFTMGVTATSDDVAISALSVAESAGPTFNIDNVSGVDAGDIDNISGPEILDIDNLSGVDVQV